MKKYLLKRVAHIIIVFFGITIISFAVMHMAPGKPTDLVTQLNPKMDLEAREKLDRIFGFDKPLYVQYFTWLGRLMKFDLGRSFIDQRPVAEKIIERLPVTLTINLISIFLIFMIAIPAGVYTALKRNSLFDRAATVLVFIMFAAPAFWIAMILMSLFGLHLGWLPVSGITSIDFEYMDMGAKVMDIMRHLALPIFVTSLGGIAGISRYTRDRMIAVLHEEYIKTAYAKGLTERIVIYKHALRNALLPIITILGLMIPGLISGSVIIETVFNIPGMGRLMVEAVFARDYNVLMGELVFSAFLTLAGNLIADIAYTLADPRIRYKTNE